MTATRLSLLAAPLHYPPEIQVFTAISGPVSSLSALYLSVERGDGFAGTGEVRANIEFLSHLPEAEVAPAIRRLVEAIDWSAEPEAILEAMPDAPPIARAAVESALLDGIARRDGVTVAETLGGAWRDRVATNNCLFWSPDEVFDRLARRYVAEGFPEIKIRIGIGDFARDLARLERLSELVGGKAAIAADANGAWTEEVAVERLRGLERFGLAYLEQPTPTGDWAAFEAVGRRAPMPVMLDEGLKTAEDAARLCRLGPPFLAHLKIVKLGGPRAVVAAARRFADAGIGVMMGQMNEGAMATALATHCAMAIRPRFAELYGCYGLVDDLASGLHYRDGAVMLKREAGLGVAFDPARAMRLWDLKRS